MDQPLFLLILGFVISLYGTIVGAGGGFLLVPALLLLYPEDSPRTITTISLAAVALNAMSGTLAYARLRRLRFPMVLYLGAASLPAAAMGAWATRLLPRGWFDLAFGLFMLALVGILLVNRPTLRSHPVHPSGALGIDEPPVPRLDGWLLGAVGFADGLLSNLAGIGGGPVLMPLLLRVLHLPLPTAVATSTFVIMLASLTGLASHAVAGDFDFELGRILLIAAGVLPGAQVGAHLAGRISPRVVVILLVVGMAIVAGRLAVAGTTTLLQ
ncbi:MAG: hypothetical protein HW416_573 [Chloroflexi bacterium]|nr:hypothetical protein [Chloroflexota bacterium]